MADPILYLTDDQAAGLAPDVTLAVGLVAGALRAIAAGRTSLAHQVVHSRPGTGLSALVGVIGGQVDLAGQKWVSEAPAGAGVSALILMNDPETGAVQAIMGARQLTGLRTAAVSGACIQALAHEGSACIVGTGLQCRTHLAVLDMLGFRSVRIAYRRHSSGQAVADWASRHLPRMRIMVTEQIEAAVRDATVVITAVTRGTTGASVRRRWLRRDALVLPVDFAHCIDGETAQEAQCFATDHPDTYAEALAHGALPGYPAALLATGTVIDQPRSGGMTVIQNLGNAACDLVIAEHVRRTALSRGVGLALER